MAITKKITGHSMVFVRVGTGADVREVPVHYGEPLPAGVSTVEMKRLEDVGAFNDPPRYLLPPEQRPPLTAGLVPVAAVTAVEERTAEELAAKDAELAARDEAIATLQAQLDEATKPKGS